MAGTTFTDELQLALPGIGDPNNVNNWGNLINSDSLKIIDTALTGVGTIALSNANVNITSQAGQPDQSRFQLYEFTGTLTANVTVYWPVSLSRSFTVSNQTTGAFTVTIASSNGSGSAAGQALVVPQGYTLDYYTDGTNMFQRSYAPSLAYSFNAASPPTNPISLNLGDVLTITATSVTSVPFSVATAQGIYRIVWVCTATPSENNDTLIEPNNQLYDGAFQSWGATMGDVYWSAFGTATAPAGFADKTAQAYMARTPVVYKNYYDPSSTAIALSTFYCGGPNGPSFDADTGLNSAGPEIYEMICSTFTAGKAVLFRGGTYGGSFIYYSTWVDTTTVWSSLGTMYLMNPPSGSPGATISGTVIVTRLA